MNNRRPRRIFDFAENPDQRFDRISVPDIAIVKTERLKHVTLGLAAGFPQQPQVGIQTAVVFGNRHFVVVDDNNDVTVKHRRIAQSLQRFAAGKRTVADHRDHVVLFAPKVARFGQTAGQADGSRRMADDKKVVFALIGIGIAGNFSHFLNFEKTVLASGENLVRIALVRNVVNNFVFRRIKHIMQSNCGFDNPQVGTDVAADFAVAVKHRRTDFAGQRFHFRRIQLFQVFG